MNKPADNVSAEAPTTADTNLDSSTAVDPTDSKRRRGLGRKGLLIAAAASIGLLGVGGGTAAAMSKEVVITVDGQQQQVTTLASSVDGALATAGLQVGEHDLVAPAADATISDGSHIALERARPLTLTINGQQRQVWTTADTVDQALVQLGQDPAALDLSADRSREIPLGGLELTANALRTVSALRRRPPRQEGQTGAKTVADVLKEQGDHPRLRRHHRAGAHDRGQDGQQIKVSRVTVKTVTQTVAIAPKDVRTDDPKLDKGSTVVAARGSQESRRSSSR